MIVLDNIKSKCIEIYNSRNILRSLIINNLIGRYKNSLLGFLWNFITPIIMMIVYYVVFTQIRTSDIDYFWIYISSALFPFNFMISNLTSGAGCIVSNSGMIKKMYFPREIIVISQVLSSFIITIIGYIIVLFSIVLSGFGINWSILFLPIILIIMVFFTLGYTLVISSLTVYVRDIQYLISSISMVFFFMTPMYFLSNSVSGILGTVIWINPFTYFVESFHDIVYFGQMPSSGYIIICVSLSVISLLVGTVVFNKLKKGFVERL